jgi:hypothetical protein
MQSNPAFGTWESNFSAARQNLRHPLRKISLQPAYWKSGALRRFGATERSPNIFSKFFVIKYLPISSLVSSICDAGVAASFLESNICSKT